MAAALPFIQVGIAALGAFSAYKSNKAKADGIGAGQMPFIPAPPYVGSDQVAARLRQKGKMSLNQAKRENERLEAEGKMARAVSHRDAIEAWKAGRITASDAVTAVVASGGTTDDISELLADVDATAEYNAMSRLWEGDMAATAAEFKGDMALHQGQVASLDAGYEADMAIADGNYQNAMIGYQNQWGQWGHDVDALNADHARKTAQKSAKLSGIMSMASVAASAYGQFANRPMAPAPAAISPTATNTYRPSPGYNQARYGTPAPTPAMRNPGYVKARYGYG